MGFDIYQMRPLQANRFALKRVRSLALGGKNGFFAKFLPSLAIAKDQWELSSNAILDLEGGGELDSHRLFFDLTPNSTEKVNLMEVISISGRTVSMVTDAVFHFKVACADGKRADLTDPSQGLILPDWQDFPDRIEQLRLEGGTRGGTWAWSEVPQATTATILG